MLNRQRCNRNVILIEHRTQKKKILQRYADPLYLIPSNPCNAISKCSSIGTRILISLTWRTRCIRNAPCRCIAYAVSSFSAGTSSQYTFFSCSATLQQTLIQIGRDRSFIDYLPFPVSLDGTVVERVPVLFLPFEIRFSGWERKQPGDRYCVRTVE